MKVVAKGHDAKEVGSPGRAERTRASYVEALDSEAAFAAYSETVATERYAKLLIEIPTDRIYYFDANAYPVHADFVLAELTRRWSPRSRLLSPLADLYNRWRVRERLKTYDRNYEADKPEFLLGTVVHHTDQDVYTLALWEGDEAGPADVRYLYDRVRQTFHRGDALKFRPNSTRQENLLDADELSGVPSITNDELYKDAPYHAFSEGTAVGRLRICRDGTRAGLHFAPDEIIVLTDIVPDITPVRGLVTEHFCTPLAHVALRARAWGIPHVGWKECSAAYAHLDGAMVVLEARREGATLREATEADVAADEERRAARSPVDLPPPALEERALRPLSEIGGHEARAYGAKAANLGEVARRARAYCVPPGFGIPVAYYAEHMERHGLWRRARALVADERVRDDATFRDAELARLRREILAAPIDDALVAAIAERLAACGAERSRVFVRSSTNAEDLAGLNGAGLYDSVPNVQGTGAVADAVKRVWASVWNLRAYDERCHFGIDHEAVHAAVLVLGAVEATAAGVLVTANVFDGGAKQAYTINAKHGVGIGVVEGTKVPEQILYDVREGGIKIMSRSSDDTMLVFDEARGGVVAVPDPEPGRPVLADDQVRTLARAAEALERAFPDDGPLDIEWLFRDDELYVVQSRPYVGL